MHRFAIATVAVTFFLLLVGGIVHGTGSSLACPDWPTCFDTFFPEMKGNVFYEHGHRQVATFVGCLTIALAALLLRERRSVPSFAWLGPVAVVMVILQGALGGITVLYKLPTMVSVAHLSVAMIFFSLLIYIAFRTRFLRGEPTRSEVSPGLHRLVGIATVAVFMQVVLGALVRHTGGGMACADEIPLCQGQLWPAAAHATVKLQMLHRLFAIVVSALAVTAAVRVHRATRGQAFVPKLALAVPVLVLTQITLGVLSVLSFLALVPVTAHLGVGALLLANLCLLYLATQPMPSLQEAHS
jgi:heme A synthase